jgi:hypothetical protein
MVIATLKGWKTKQLDFVLDFPQAPVETDLYMEKPTGFAMEKRNEKIFKLMNNLYGQKQAGRVWNLLITEGLIKLGFSQSANDPCIFWRKLVIMIVYTNDTIFTEPCEAEIDKSIKEIGSNFDITKKG